jgi:hypothetical protein
MAVVTLGAVHKNSEWLGEKIRLSVRNEFKLGQTPLKDNVPATTCRIWKVKCRIREAKFCPNEVNYASPTVKYGASSAPGASTLAG